MNFTLVDFEDILNYVADMVGPDFKAVIVICNHILEYPEDYSGIKAASVAKKLAAYRTRIGVVNQYYKQRRTETKSGQDRLTVDALSAMYISLEELINCLKLVVRHEGNILS